MRQPLAGAGRIAGLTSLVLLASCSAIRMPPDEPDVDVTGADVDLTGAYVGAVSVEGQRIASRLDLVQRGDGLEAVLRADELGLTAQGDGDMDRDGTFALDLGYDVSCPGSARLQGRWLEEGLRLVGSVSASDCTGSFTGEFSFRRR